MKKELTVDFKEVAKEYKKLKCPKDVYNPLTIPWEVCKWAVIMSDRSRGKTTNLLLYGMILNKMYGTEIQYIRSHEDMIAPKNCKDLFETILQYHYVETLTDGKFNTIIYDKRRWYYAKTDDDGEVIEKDLRQFCTMLSVDKNQVYKSSYNAPNGDFILFDEFIEKFYYPNEFIYFLDLIKTICRDRTTPLIALSANTIDKQSPYLRELEIYKDVQKMKMGSSQIVTTALGTKIYVSILSAITKKENALRMTVNKLYFGFQNSKIASITGSETWSMSSYPHSPEERHILSQNHYILFNDNLLQMEICDSTEMGIFVNIHEGKKLHDDSVVYTLEPPIDKRYRYALGWSKLDRLIWDKYRNNLFYYQYNDIGDMVEKFYNQAKKGT